MSDAPKPLGQIEPFERTAPAVRNTKHLIFFRMNAGLPAVRTRNLSRAEMLQFFLVLLRAINPADKKGSMVSNTRSISLDL